MSEEVSNKDVFNWAINNLEQIPIGVYSASVYKTDTTHVIHLWDDNGNSFDFVCPRAEFVDAPQEVRPTPRALDVPIVTMGTACPRCGGCEYQCAECLESARQ